MVCVCRKGKEIIMNKEEYLRKLEKSLRHYQSEEREELLSSFLQHFQSASLEGKSDEEIIRELGSIEELFGDEDEVTVKVDGDNFSQSIKDLVSNSQKLAAEALRKSYSALSDSLQFVSVSLDQLSYEDAYSDEISDEIKEIKVVAKSLDIELKQGEDSFTYVPCVDNNGELSQMDILVEDNSLILKADEGLLTIALNKEYKLTLVSENGDIDIENCKGNSLRLQSKNGDLNLENIKFNKVYLKTTSGDINIEDSSMEDGYFETTSGDICFEEVVGDLVSVTTVSGDIDCACDITKLKLTTVSGDITLENESNELLKVKTVSGDIELALPNNCKGQIKTSSGDVDISKDNKKKGFGLYELIGEYGEIEVSSVSGDIEIN